MFASLQTFASPVAVRADPTTTTGTQGQVSSTAVNMPDNYNYPPNDNSPHAWYGITVGHKIAIIVGTLVFIAVLFFGLWWWCFGGREKQRQRRMNSQGLPLQNQLPPLPPPVPLDTLSSAHSSQRHGLVAGEMPPPQYEEAVPPRHQTIAGGITHVRQEEEGIISDGKTPLSEIPFEDVVITSTRSESSSSRNFEQAHRVGGGNTSGHTNS